VIKTIYTPYKKKKKKKSLRTGKTSNPKFGIYMKTLKSHLFKNQRKRLMWISERCELLKF
jgi:hypothetical protein